jgi:subtilase family serine protease
MFRLSFVCGPPARRVATVALTAALACVLALGAAAEAPDPNVHTRRICGALLRTAACLAEAETNARGLVQATTTPIGLNPADFWNAYSLPGLAGSGGTVAVVDAFDDPTIENDLGVFSAQFGLPACTTVGGCFRKIDQFGGSRYPRAKGGWALEISLDVEVVHAICPRCNILLVEAKSGRIADLMAAVDQAVAQGASVVSNSYGTGEFPDEVAYDAHFDHPGVPITASSGDGGFGVIYPAASPFVTAVGGTRLVRSPTGWTETAWRLSGSGCSAFEPKPSWQTDSGCPGRVIADVAADGDPKSGASVYDSTPYAGQTGWFKLGGTSLSAPIVAAVYALAGNGAATTYGSYPYQHASALYDVTSGSTGQCSPSYLCTSGPGFDGPTGLGTPRGLGGF